MNEGLVKGPSALVELSLLVFDCIAALNIEGGDEVKLFALEICLLFD